MTKNLAASLRAKLLLRAKADGVDFNRMLVRYGIERILYRLSIHEDARRRFILKGAMLFIAWREGVPRPTADLDLLGSGSSEIEPMRALFTDICAVEAEDGIVFDPKTIDVAVIREEQEYQGLRVTLTAKLDGARIPVQVDIGFGDVVYPAVQRVEFPTLIEGMVAPKIDAYPPATVVAEKFEAMVQLGLQNSRLKDYFDIWMISQYVSFQRAELAQAMAATLQRRGTLPPTAIPVALTNEFIDRQDKQDLWKSFLNRTVHDRNDLELSRVAAELRTFLGPVVQVLNTPETATGNWTPGIGWRT
jgi:hypothetical protein